MAILIFDYDGTIHDSMRIYAPAVRACQEEYASRGLLPEREVPDAEIRSYLGLTTVQMWQVFAPHLSQEQQKEGGEYIFREMVRLARAGRARLYDGAVSMLQELKEQGHRLVFLSNCSEAYMKLHQEVFGLDRIFHEMYCSGQFGWEAKPQIVRRLIPGWKKAADPDRQTEAAESTGRKAAPALPKRTEVADPAGRLKSTDLPGRPDPLVIISIGDRYTDMEIKLAQNAGSEAPEAKASEAKAPEAKTPEAKAPEVMAPSVKIRTIFCAYGFGTPEEGANADAVVYSVKQIPEKIPERIPEKIPE